MKVIPSNTVISNILLFQIYAYEKFWTILIERSVTNILDRTFLHSLP